MRVAPVGLRTESGRLPQELLAPECGADHGTHRGATIYAAALAGTAEIASAETVPALPAQAPTGDPVFADRSALHSPNPPIKRRRPDWMTDWTTGTQNPGGIEPETKTEAENSIPANRGDPDSPSASQRLK